MIMEAIPFVLIGVLISGLIQIFITERWIARVMPRNRILSSLFGCSVGLLFPSCECGIVPITRRLLNKGVPLNAGIAFMLTGPVINPIVLFSTFIAFGNSWKMVFVRAGLAVAVAFLVSVCVAFLFPRLPFRGSDARLETAAAVEFPAQTAAAPRRPLLPQLYGVLTHAIDEFFSVGKFLVLGAFIAACMQTYIPTASLLHLGSNPVTASLVMIGLAFVMSLCSEADAFIAASFRSTFSTGALSAFLVFGPMIDIKNTLMLLGTFKAKFVAVLIALVTVFTLIGSLIVGRLTG
jgi:uncharacterized membrane protein YraQ (UPF0718 family)